MSIRQNPHIIKTIGFLILFTLIPLFSQCSENRASTPTPTQASFKYMTAEDDGNTWLQATEETKKNLCKKMAKTYIEESCKTELFDKLSNGDELRDEMENIASATFYVILEEYYNNGSPGAKSESIAGVAATTAAVLHRKLQEGAPALVKYRVND